MNNKKICVYAICKNEIKNVDKWLDSMSEADDIVVLDTGSTDGTYEKLKADSRVTRVEQKVITPWRFDVARNESLKLVTDADILVCTDFDEVFEPGWGAILKANWKDDTVRCFYPYIWSHDENGEPNYTFKSDKIHANHDYYWKHPVHEYLSRYDDPEESCEYERIHHISIDNIKLHHYQDTSKPRASYLHLLKLRVDEDPLDAYGWYYLAREYGGHGYPADELECYLKAVSIFEDNPNKVDAFGMWMASYEQLAKWYCDRGNTQKAIEYYQKALFREHLYREPFLKLAEIYNQLGQYYLAIGYVNQCLNDVPESIGHWSEEKASWEEKPWDILSVAYYNTGNIEKAKRYVALAYKTNPNDKRIAQNYEIIQNNEVNT